MPRLASIRLLTVLCAFALSATAIPAAHAVPAGTGVRGTLLVTWGGISGAPITSWNGSLNLEFDPSQAARQATLAAAADPALGEPTETVRAGLVQAARVTQLVSDKSETVLCPTDDGGSFSATYASNVTGIADPRVAFEISAPIVDLIAGTGQVRLHPYVQTIRGAGDTGWWANDRNVVPGRWTMGGAYPCPGPAGTAADRLPRITAVNGQAAVPLAFTDWLAFQGRDWKLRRTTAGWRVVADLNRRETFSESRFGPQDTQQLDLRVQSRVYLAGGLAQLGARCKVPKAALLRARTATAAVLLAKRAGQSNTTFAGTRVSRHVFRPRYVIESPSIDSMSHAPCLKGRYRIWREVPSS